MFQLDVAPGVLFVEGERRGRFPFGNMVVLQGRAQRVLVDTGAGGEVFEAVAAGGPIDVVINTHYHVDHVRGNGRFLAATPLQPVPPAFWCPVGEAEAFTSEEAFLRFTGFGLPGFALPGGFHRSLGWIETPIDRELADGEVLDFGGLEAVVLRLPGHTPGHTGLWFPAHGVVFAADIDLSSFGPWYGDVYSSIDDYLASLRRLDALVEEVSGGGRHRVTILTSHRRPLSYETFRDRLPPFVTRVDEREDRLLAVLAADGPLSLKELAARWPIYGPRATKLPGLWKSEWLMVRHHLDRLVRAGRVERIAASGVDGAASSGADGSAVAEAGRPSTAAGAAEVQSGGKDLWRAL